MQLLQRGMHSGIRSTTENADGRGMPLEVPGGVDPIADRSQGLAGSALEPEISSDEFNQLIRHLCATENLDAVLEIGSSSGYGSTEAFVAGLSRNPGSPRLFCVEVSRSRFDQL